MKTQEEFMIEFQRKFDKERRKEAWKLLYYFPVFILINAGIILYGYFFLFILGAPLWVTCFVSCVLFFAIIGFNITYPSEFFETFNSIKKREQIRQQIHEKAKAKEKWLEKTKFIEPVCDGETLEIWMKLALEYHCFSTEHIKEIIIKERELFDQELVELNAQLKVYDQSPEKNFWQYVKSKKWLKKTN